VFCKMNRTHLNEIARPCGGHLGNRRGSVWCVLEPSWGILWALDTDAEFLVLSDSLQTNLDAAQETPRRRLEAPKWVSPL
jgi:hypothetical protein